MTDGQRINLRPQTGRVSLQKGNLDYFARCEQLKKLG
jgi:hypothetical protein